MTKRVLVVDDQPELRKLITMTLKMGDYEVQEAEDATQGLEKVNAFRPDILLLDVMMPGEMDGYQLCQLLKSDEKYQGLAVVLLTARGQASDLEEGDRVGADKYLVKPFSPLQLIQTVRELTA
ncbi:response regulator [Litorivicinus lipolyticus]|uniref:Response regulator n=1 Tax=Litorivicinus lipolyticus TaxID=418701 RepID=A0A5Q2QDB6_9GAMM|nr:response regulator [Litorivicinus lipolyticus]QGG80322.1 response regulator [Litorivicinus lipolyticus]